MGKRQSCRACKGGAERAREGGTLSYEHWTKMMLYVYVNRLLCKLSFIDLLRTLLILLFRYSPAILLLLSSHTTLPSVT
jgi:hypothetical protein